MKEELSKQINILFSLHSDWDSVTKESVLPIFSQGVIDFFSEFSLKINKHFDSRKYPDLVTFAFFCRKSNLRRLFINGRYVQNENIGRGLTYHIAPSNVPLNFAYSLLMGMLAGNINVVRLPSKKFEQVEIFLEILNTLHQIKKFHDILSKIILVKYERNKELNDFFSGICANRVIWGGDLTINEIRKSPLSARSYDITFSDRYSMCILDINAILECSDLEKLASNFYNDTYLFDQNACTSPHLIFWVGDERKIVKAKNKFWNEINKILINKKYQIEVSSVIDKIVYAQEKAIEGDIISFHKINNSLFIVEIDKLSESITNSHSNCGYFNNFYCKNLSEIISFLDSPKYQTITYYGVKAEHIKSIVFDNGLKGIDRIVPVGSASDFSSIWDGYDVINSLSRNIKIL